ncbi:MAG: SET domain-containing protein [Anaerolineales bacterium]|nr:SET domain-containing protein [Anaerolineales bacterium]
MSLSYLNPKCEARENPQGGCGVFAKSFIPAGTLISIWGGDIVHKEKLDPNLPRFTQRVLQIDEELYILTSDEPEPNDCFNHSCEPNLGFSGQVALMTLRDVKVGEELCFDYAMSDGGPYDEFQCLCGAPTCRGKVTGNDWQLPGLWKKYDGYFSTYLAKRIENIKK